MLDLDRTQECQHARDGSAVRALLVFVAVEGLFKLTLYDSTEARPDRRTGIEARSTGQTVDCVAAQGRPGTIEINILNIPSQYTLL